MKRGEFVGALKEKGYSYETKGNKIVVTHRGSVNLKSLKTIPPGVEFRNTENVWLDSLETVPSGVEFRNSGNAYLGSLVGGWFYSWEGNIEGIDPKNLLNKMIADAVFDRR